MTTQDPTKQENIDARSPISSSEPLTTAHRTHRRPGLAQDIILGVLVLNGAAAVVAAIWIFVSIRLAALVVIFGAFGLFAVMVQRPRLSPMFLFFFILSGYEAIVLEEYLVAAFGGYEKDVRVSMISQYPDVSIVEFSDGHTRLDLFGKNVMASKAGDSRVGVSYSFVAPYVSAGWKREQPVTVFATCHLSTAGNTGSVNASIDGCGDFGVSTKTAVVVPESGFFRAREDAIARHGIQADPNALFVEFVADPMKYIYDKRTWTIWFPLVINGLFILTILIIGIIFNRHHRPSRRPPAKP